MSAAIKKGKAKNVVCTKTIVAKQETVRPMPPWHLLTCQPSLITIVSCVRDIIQVSRISPEHKFIALCRWTLSSACVKTSWTSPTVSRR